MGSEPVSSSAFVTLCSYFRLLRLSFLVVNVLNTRLTALNCVENKVESFNFNPR